MNVSDYGGFGRRRRPHDPVTPGEWASMTPAERVTVTREHVEAMLYTLGVHLTNKEQMALDAALDQLWEAPLKNLSALVADLRRRGVAREVADKLSLFTV